jgi:23S rRNA pseudouridine1911/1915/1917 synthase
VPRPVSAGTRGLTLVVDDELVGLRLDEMLERRGGIARRALRGLEAAGRVRVDGRALLAGAPRLGAGVCIEILDGKARPERLAERIPLTILHEDERLLLVDKPAPMATSPGPGWPAGTLANALRGLGRPLSLVEGPLRPGIVHRLDVGTSGVMVVAKDDETHRRLVALFAAHVLDRRYLALVEGRPAWHERLVDGALGKRRVGRRAFAVVDDGWPARTALRVREHLANAALVEAAPETGRTHQIRVHLASVGHAVIGDTLYGGGDPAARRAARIGLCRPALHAARLACAELGFDASTPLPPDMATALSRLRR